MGVSSRAVPFTVVPSLGQALRALSVVCVGAALFQPVPASAGPGGPGTPAPVPSAVAPAAAPAVSLAKSADDAAAEAQAPAAATDPFLDFFRKTEISGIVDTYYTYNFNEPPTGTFTPVHGKRKAAHNGHHRDHGQHGIVAADIVPKPADHKSSTPARPQLSAGNVRTDP